MTIAVLVQSYELEAAKAFIDTSAVISSDNTFLFYLKLTRTGWKLSGYDFAASIARSRKHLPIIPFSIFVTFPLDKSLILVNYPEFFI